MCFESHRRSESNTIYQIEQIYGTTPKTTNKPEMVSRMLHEFSPEGPGGGTRRGATAAAVGPGGDRLGSGHIRILYNAPQDYTKPQQTIQRHRILAKY